MATVLDQLIDIIKEELDAAPPHSEVEKVLKRIIEKQKVLYNTDDFTNFPS